MNSDLRRLALVVLHSAVAIIGLSLTSACLSQAPLSLGFSGNQPSDTPAFSVYGITFMGTVSGISSTNTWASDLRMDLVTSTADEFSVGGYYTGAAPVPWDFDGSASDLDGTYTSSHPNVFPAGTAAVGAWAVNFEHTWASGAPMTWTNVKIGLLDAGGEQIAAIEVPDFAINATQSISFSIEPHPIDSGPPTIRTNRLFSSRFEPQPQPIYPRIEFMPDQVMIFNELGQTRTVSVRVFDAQGQQVINPSVNWSSAAPGSVSVTPIGPSSAVVESVSSWIGTVPLTVSWASESISAQASAIMADLSSQTRLLPSNWVFAIYGDVRQQHQVILELNATTQNYQVNDILLSGDLAGIMARIVQISISGGQVLLTVEPVGFGDAFINLELDTTGDGVQVILSAAQDGSELIVRRQRDGQVLSRDVLPQASVSHLLQCTGGLNLATGGNVGVSQFDLTWSFQPQVKLVLANGIVTEVSYRLSGQAILAIPQLSVLLNAGQNRNGRCQVVLNPTTLPASMNALIIDAVINARTGFEVAASSSANNGWVQVTDLARNWTGIEAGFRYTPALGLQGISGGSASGPVPVSTTVPQGPMALDVKAFVDIGVDIELFQGQPINSFLAGQQPGFLRLEGGPSWLFSVAAPVDPDLLAYQGPTMHSGVHALAQLKISNDLPSDLEGYFGWGVNTGFTQSPIIDNVTLAQTPQLSGSVSCPGGCSSLTAGSDSITLSLSGNFSGSGMVQFLAGQPGDAILTELASTTAINGNASTTVTLPASLNLGTYQVYSRLCLNNSNFSWFCTTLPMASIAPIGSFAIGQTPPPPPVFRPLNDTGIDWCVNEDTNFLDCPVVGFPGQDGDHGRDALARKGLLNKVGAGAAGFDFTKLDASGNDLPDTATNWSCVRDNHTGLVWEIKVDNPAHLRHKDHTYTWYNPDPGTNGGDAGMIDGGDCSGSVCDTLGFVQAVNEQGLCGSASWRVPSLTELKSLAHRGRNNPAIDVSYFPSIESEKYWSSSSTARYAERAWGFSFLWGYRSSNHKRFGPQRAFLVSGGHVPLPAELASMDYDLLGEDECTNTSVARTTPSSDFTAIGDGSIVRHETTGLEWQRCPVGQTWSNDTCASSPETLTWQEAIDFAFAFGGGWRLPNSNELASLVEDCRLDPAINRQVFPYSGGPGSSFWSASPSAGASSSIWATQFYDGISSGGHFRSNRYRVRLVRDAQ